MTLIKPTDKPEITLVYTTNNCPKCKMTKRQLDAKNIPYETINIQDGDHEQEYIDMLKNEQEIRMAMPFVFPAQSTGLASWNDFRNDKIKELIAALEA